MIIIIIHVELHLKAGFVLFGFANYSKPLKDTFFEHVLYIKWYTCLNIVSVTVKLSVKLNVSVLKLM